MVLPYSDRIPRAPPYSYTHDTSTSTGLSPFFASLPRLFEFYVARHWPCPLSLTTTNGVSFDFLSSGYLDVSVPRVHLLTLYIQAKIPINRWVTPFGYPRIKAYCQLPAAFRSLSRPSSAPCTKASSCALFVALSFSLFYCIFAIRRIIFLLP